jgi:hypothetical protein
MLQIRTAPLTHVNEEPEKELRLSFDPRRGERPNSLAVAENFGALRRITPHFPLALHRNGATFRR